MLRTLRLRFSSFLGCHQQLLYLSLYFIFHIYIYILLQVAASSFDDPADNDWLPPGHAHAGGIKEVVGRASSVWTVSGALCGFGPTIYGWLRCVCIKPSCVV